MISYKVTSPTRADLAGGTLDLWPLYCLTEDSRTINIALDLTETVHFVVLKEGKFRIKITSAAGESHSFDRPPETEMLSKVPPSVRFPAAVVSYFLKSREPTFNQLEMRIETDVPVGSGLGGSSSLCIALVRGLAHLTEEFRDQGWQWDLLDWARDAEASYLRMPTGTQDYLAALFGGLNSFEYEVGAIHRSGFPAESFAAISERMLVLFSGESHNSGLSNWEIFKGAMEGSAPILAGLKDIAGVASDLDGELRVGRFNWKFIGKCLNEEWRIRRTLFKVETRRLNEITDFLSTKSILGAKVCGAAQGGSLLVLVEPEHKASVAKACQDFGIKVLPVNASLKGVSLLPSR